MDQKIANIKDLAILNELIAAKEAENKAYKRLFGQEPNGLGHEFISVPRASQLRALATLLNKPINKVSYAGVDYFEVEYGTYTLTAIGGCA